MVNLYMPTSHVAYLNSLLVPAEQAQELLAVAGHVVPEFLLTRVGIRIPVLGAPDQIGLCPELVGAQFLTRTDATSGGRNQETPWERT